MCLPPNDAGGVGPKVESWAYAVDSKGLSILLVAGVYEVYADTKFGNSGIIVRGEPAAASSALRTLIIVLGSPQVVTCCEVHGLAIRLTGEYGISTFVLAAGYNIATLMSRYAQVCSLQPAAWTASVAGFMLLSLL